MELKTTEEVIAHAREWAIDKVESAELVGDKIALYAEFEEEKIKIMDDFIKKNKSQFNNENLKFSSKLKK